MERGKVQWCWVWHMRVGYRVWCLAYRRQGGNQEDVPADLNSCGMCRRWRAMNCNTICVPLAHSQPMACSCSARVLASYGCYLAATWLLLGTCAWHHRSNLKYKRTPA